MKNHLKYLAAALAIGVVFPIWLFYRAASVCLDSSRVFPGFSETFALLPGIGGVYLRKAFYRLTLRECGDSAWIGFGTIISHAGTRIGNRVYIGAYCSIGEITIEDDVLLASHVSVTNGNGQHAIDRLDVPIREQLGTWPRVTIGRDSWIGERSVVMADIGDHCVIGAGSVVTRPIPDRAVAFGVPAKVARFRGDGPVGSATRHQRTVISGDRPE